MIRNKRTERTDGFTMGILSTGRHVHHLRGHEPVGGPHPSSRRGAAPEHPAAPRVLSLSCSVRTIRSGKYLESDQRQTDGGFSSFVLPGYTIDRRVRDPRNPENRTNAHKTHIVSYDLELTHDRNRTTILYTHTRTHS